MKLFFVFTLFALCEMCTPYNFNIITNRQFKNETDELNYLNYTLNTTLHIADDLHARIEKINNKEKSELEIVLIIVLITASVLSMLYSVIVFNFMFSPEYYAAKRSFKYFIKKNTSRNYMNEL